MAARARRNLLNIAGADDEEAAPAGNLLNAAPLAVDDYGRTAEDLQNPDFRRGEGQAILGAMPGAGLVRAAGYGLSWKGDDGFLPTGGIQREPSLADLLGEGHYGQAALSGLGALGDLSLVGGLGAKGLGLLGSEAAAPTSVGGMLRDGHAAIGKVLESKSDVLGGMTHPDLGGIDFRWNAGESGGLEKVFSKHGEDSVRDIPDVLARGSVGEPYFTEQGRPRVQVTYGPKQVILAPDYGGDPSRWIVSSYDIYKSKK